jgi:hypothetical protein
MDGSAGPTIFGLMMVFMTLRPEPLGGGVAGADGVVGGLL